MDVLRDEGERIIHHVCFIAFISGKEKAADETDFDYWSIENNDLPILKTQQDRFTRNYFQILGEIEIAAHGASLGLKEIRKYLRRIEAVIQMSVWTCYNKGKLALWDDPLFKRFQSGELSEGKLKFAGQYMFLTERDDMVCQLCGPLSGETVEDPHSLEEPPLHINCRCEIIAVPLAKLQSEQERFANKFDLISPHDQEIAIRKGKLDVLKYGVTIARKPPFGIPRNRLSQYIREGFRAKGQ